MSHFTLRRVCLVATLLALLIVAQTQRGEAQDAASGKPFLHPLFTDHMVFQRGIKAPVWGWTQPGKKVTVGMDGKTATATAGPDGKWMAALGPFTAGGPYTLTVNGPETAKVEDVLIGDVWICSGQSNMEMGIGNVYNAQDEIAKAANPNIRLFSVPKKIAGEPQETVASHWDTCTPQTVANGGWNGFSAVGYFFGRHLQETQHVPIGLIHTSWGGTIAEAWTSASALRTMPDFAPQVDAVEKTYAEMKKDGGSFDKMLADWYTKNDPGGAHNWGAADFDSAAWKTMKLPTAWEAAGLPDYDGVVWFRKDFDLPDGWAGKTLTLHLGPIDDDDTTFVNGVQVGATRGYNIDRVYKIPASVLKAGHNVIAVRVLDTGGAGGLNGTPDKMFLTTTELGAGQSMPLAGDWKYQDSAPLTKANPVPMQTADNPNVTTVLYNGMIAPLLPYGIKGAIWYQGESNAGRGMQYRTLLPTMIKDWRSRFGVGEFPFFIVQLANFTPVVDTPIQEGWADLREAQLLTSENLPKTGIAVAIDIGDAGDIHPKNKQEVGRRLGLSADAIAYGDKVEYSGPLYKSMKVEGDKIRLTFTHLGGGLVTKDGGPLKGFAIAGADKHFEFADAKIEGDTIVVSSAKVSNPTAVRYAWANNPICNLVNKAGLPASSFRTDADAK
ncbi:MAG: Sialic acid-specific 9-O-acetylesterase [Chthonomonadaceae bacterium]|nr:Sialic acid-specific 9-O-acetylesterase [Chthonomonadaceae bacterium]